MGNIKFEKFMRSFVAIALAAYASAMDINEDVVVEFMKFVADFGKSYGTNEEYHFRLEQFARKHAELAELSEKLTTSTVGHNIYSDWTENEF